MILDVDPQRSASAWRSLRSDKCIAVHSCLPKDVEVMLARARSKAIDFVLIDNAPNWTSASPRIAALADLTIVTVRPAGFDLVVGLDRVKFLSQQRPSTRFVVVIGPAPAQRLGQDNPLVRSAREALRHAGGRVWQRQITHRHAVVESVGHGKTLMETAPNGPAAREYCRLWDAIITEMQRT